MTNFFQSRYYTINKFYLSSIGLWPYQSRRQRFLLLALQACHILLQIPPLIIGTVKGWDDPKIIAELTACYLATIASSIRLISLVINFSKISEGFRTEHNWISAAEQPEIDIISNYAEAGRRIVTAYSIGVSFFAALFMTKPFVPRILKFMKLTNETLPKKLPVPFDYYGLDVDTYYYYVLIFMYLAIINLALVFIAADAMFLSQIQYACGKFAVVGYHLQRMGNYITEEYVKYSHPKLDPAFRHLTICIKRHRDAVAFGEFLDNSYTWVIFICLGTGMLSLSYSSVKTVSLIEIDPEEALHYVAFEIAIIFIIFFFSFFAQRLLDHSQQIGEDLRQVEWYKTSLATQKLFILLTMRTHIPCQLTAGKFMALSIGNFTLILKTCFSYFTFLRSMQ